MAAAGNQVIYRTKGKEWDESKCRDVECTQLPTWRNDV